MQKLVALERQAYGLAADENPTPPPLKVDGEDREDADFTRIREKVAKSVAAMRIGSVTDAEFHEPDAEAS